MSRAPNPIFDVDPGNVPNIKDLMVLVSTTSYIDFYVPLLLATRDRLMRELADPSVQRKWKRPDDYLRGAIMAIEAMIRIPNDILEANAQAHQENDQDEPYEARWARQAGVEPGPSAPDPLGVSPSDPIGA